MNSTLPLPSTFHHDGWQIRYYLSPSLSPTDTPPANLLVFLHGTPWSSAVLAPLIKALLARKDTRCRILTYDLPGYGSSQTYTPSASSTSKDDEKLFEGDTSIAFQSSTLVSLLSSLFPQSPPSYHILAHDIAGTLSLRAHLLHHLPVSSLLLLSTNTLLPWGDGFYTLLRSSPTPFLSLPAPIFAAMLKAVITSAFHTPQTESTIDALAAPWLNAEAGQKNFIRQIAQANDADIAAMLDGNLYGDVKCPVKIIWGECDSWIPRGKIEGLVERLGGSVEKEWVIIPEAGHLVMLDQPERVAVEVVGWVDRQVLTG